MMMLSVIGIWCLLATHLHLANFYPLLSHLMQRERKLPVLVGITILFVVHVFGFYWCYKNGDLIRPLVMLPPKEIPPFWHAIFIILVNGIFYSPVVLKIF
jgi:hypothetical protein